MPFFSSSSQNETHTMEDEYQFDDEVSIKRKRSRAPLDWSEAEDAVLHTHIEINGPKKWSLVSQALNGSKTANQCRLRWHAINPERCNEPFTEEANAHILQFVDDAIAANDGTRPKKMKWADLQEELKVTLGKCWSTLDISRQYDKLTGGGVAVGARASPSPHDGDWHHAVGRSRETSAAPPLFHQESGPSSADEGTRDPSSKAPTPPPDAAGDDVPMAPGGAVPMAPALYEEEQQYVPTHDGGGDAEEGVGAPPDDGDGGDDDDGDGGEEDGGMAAGGAAEDTTFGAGAAAAEGPPASHDSAISLNSFDWDVLDTALSYGGEGGKQGAGSAAAAVATPTPPATTTAPAAGGGDVQG